MSAPPTGASTDDDAMRITVRGIVQGVGFRPFVHRLAAQHGLTGWVRNNEAGVEIHVEGARSSRDAFLHDLQTRPPVAAEISACDAVAAPVAGLTAFRIEASSRDGAPTVRVSPDLCICADCLRELFDAGDRRHAYPYINCTNCGPRYSIIERLPYDRPYTTMAEWPMCPTCQAEYDDPGDRRYHAQPTACHVCGPKYAMVQPDGIETIEQGAVDAAVALLKQGGILAVKGIGGYHLACDMSNDAAVRAMRERKFRKEKPFAVMVRDRAAAHALADLSPAHERLLMSIARPIVLTPARSPLPLVAPDTADVGLMLPYAPLHHLLFAAGAPSPLVLTSANRSSEPIAYVDDDARERLDGIADAFLVGERPIARRVDDSVVAVRRDRPFMVRRARGYAPGVVARLSHARPILAVGADLKNAIALVVNGEAIVSQHIGDLGELETDRAFEQTVRDLLAMYDVDERELIVAHDLHPQFTSTRFAQGLAGHGYVAVQHHHAHVASVLAEHDALDARALGVILDGTGYGLDGAIWGFELFAGSVRDGFDRCASLRTVPLPGGDAAARHPLQAAAGFLAGVPDLPRLCEPPFSFGDRYFAARRLVEKDVRCFPTSSAGRLFDTVAAILGFDRAVSFEGQAAMWVEHLATGASDADPYPFENLDSRGLLAAIVADRAAGRDVREIALGFHRALARGIAVQARALCAERDLDLIALSGGCWQNRVLLTTVEAALSDAGGPRLLVNERVPVNDGGVCLGQAAIAAVGRVE